MFNIYTRLFGLYKKYSCPTNSKAVIRSFRFSTNNNSILKFNILELWCNTCFICYIPTKSLKEFVYEINFGIFLIKCYSFIDMFVCLKLFNKTCNLKKTIFFIKYTLVNLVCPPYDVVNRLIYTIYCLCTSIKYHKLF